MSEIIRAIVLGIIQGATEFIPVSSSGHLVIVPWLLGWPKPTLLFETMAHWGTLAALLVIFGRDFWQMLVAALRSIGQRSLADQNARLAWFIVAGTIPAAAAGFLFKDQFEALFASAAAPLVAGASLIITSLLLAGSEWLTRNQSHAKSVTEIGWLDAILVGLAQVLALLPGVSRSGSTIATGLTRGLRRDSAARFSFLLGAPAFFGAGLLQLLDALAEDANQLLVQIPALLAGFAVSAVTGFFAIRFLLAYLRTNNLYVFSVYCFVIGVLVIGLYVAGV